MNDTEYIMFFITQIFASIQVALLVVSMTLMFGNTSKFKSLDNRTIRSRTGALLFLVSTAAGFVAVLSRTEWGQVSSLTQLFFKFEIQYPSDVLTKIQMYTALIIGGIILLVAIFIKIRKRMGIVKNEETVTLHVKAGTYELSYDIETKYNTEKVANPKDPTGKQSAIWHREDGSDFQLIFTSCYADDNANLTCTAIRYPDIENLYTVTYVTSDKEPTTMDKFLTVCGTTMKIIFASGLLLSNTGVEFGVLAAITAAFYLIFSSFIFKHGKCDLYTKIVKVIIGVLTIGSGVTALFFGLMTILEALISSY